MDLQCDRFGGHEIRNETKMTESHAALPLINVELQNNVKDTRDGDNEENADVIVEKDYTDKALIYGVNENPPMHVAIICALQQSLLSISFQLVVSFLVAETVCASDNSDFKARYLSSTLFICGITTVAMNLFGIEYILLHLATNTTGTNSAFEQLASSEESMDRVVHNIRKLQGSLMVAGLIQAALGFTGLVGVLLRFVGPLTIVPTMILIFISIVKPSLKFVQVNWLIALSTIAIACILFLYLSKYKTPVPVWTPSGGFRIIRYPVHQVFAILISMLINWGICGILTHAGLLTDDPSDGGFAARTDARSAVITENPWFSFPYGQYGPFGFSSAAFICCLITIMISIMDSIVDYYACARVCRVPPPPIHAVNRGICIEGVCVILGGAVGVGHALSTYGGNIGAIGVTRHQWWENRGQEPPDIEVASRRVFLFTGILYMLLGMFGKLSAIFITIPYPVLGGALVIMFGIFFGVLISNLEVTDMSSSRNMAILGISVFLGLMVPTWTKMVKTPIDTGNDTADKIITVLLGNPSLVGAFLAFLLDNTVPGTKKERGMTALHADIYVEDCNSDSGYDVYRPMLPECFLQSPIMKYIPVLPYRQKKENNETKVKNINP